MTQRYRGRFAPSPTGPLHFGSLIAAVASYLQAKRHHGIWLLRIEDLDLARNQAGASDSILRCLEAHGLYWDEQPVYQSQRLAFYQQALQQLLQQQLLFYCTCSRKILNQQATPGGIYPATCRGRYQAPSHQQYAVRIQVPNHNISFIDAIAGRQTQNLAEQVGDFVVLRGDGVFAYQLAVVVDDHCQAISEVVRGADLLDNTARQIYLQQQLHYPQPDYFHVPLVRNDSGEKLSKQTGAPSLDNRQALANLKRAMIFLGQGSDNATLHAIDTLDAFWQWALQNWNPELIPRQGF